MMTELEKSERSFYLTEEKLLVRHSGEIPEVALHSSLYFLSEDPQGPHLELSPAERAVLEEQVVERYQEIILRDLTPDNRDKSLYRGLARAAVNWQRLCKFCRQTGRKESPFRREAAQALQVFLRQETAEVAAGKRASSVNCSRATLIRLAEQLGLDPATLPAGWQHLCSPLN